MFNVIYPDGYIGRRLHLVPPAISQKLRENPFTSQLHLTGIGHYPHSLYHYFDRPKGFDEHLLIYCVAGKGVIKYEGKLHEITPGTFFMLPPGRPHTYWADEKDPWSIYWIHFEGSNAHFFSDGHDHACKINFDKSSRISQRIELFEELYSLIDSGYSQSSLMYATALLTHYLGTFKFIHEFRESAVNESNDNFSIVGSCKHYMIENIERPITMSDICAYLGISQSYCTALFKTQTGMPPMRYLNNIRIQKAINLLSSSNMKINQISQKIGISDPYYFSRLFAKCLGISPTEYRKEHKSVRPDISGDL